MKYEYFKGSEKDFEGFAANVLTVYRVIGHIDSHGSLLPSIYGDAPTYRTHNTEIIAERRPITDESELNECIAPAVDRITGFYAQELSERCLDTMISIKIAEEPDVGYFATFGKCDRQCIGQPAETDSVASIIAERGKRYGKFSGGAEIMRDLKSVMHSTDGWERLSNSQQEALDMIQHKIGRVLNGDPNYDDNWKDIAGYATLVVDELNGK